MEPYEITETHPDETGETTPTPKPGLSFGKLAVGLSLLAVVTLACLGTIAYFTLGQLQDNFQRESLPASLFVDKSPVKNKIVFVGNDKNLWLVSPEGSDPRQITDDGRGYRFPTWSKDGRYLAFIGPDEKNNAALYVTPAGDSTPFIVFDEPKSAPFYLYWAPDGDSITFLTQEESSMSMRLANAKAGTSRVLAQGAPFYWVWSPVGDRVLMHVGGSRAISEQAHLSILENREDANRIELGLAPGRFQAPNWSSDGTNIFYIAADDEGQESIYKMNAETLEQALITELTGFAFMVLSPTDENIAYLQIEEDDQAPFGTAYLVDADGAKVGHRLADHLVGSMYWSPDGTKLAMLTIGRQNDGSTARAGGLAAPLRQEIVFRWLIYDLETEELELLTSFFPTRDFLQTVPFFDQYHLSLTFWSPDSRYLVITKREEGDNEGTIWVLDTDGEEEPRQIGEGTLAVWSWQ